MTGLGAIETDVLIVGAGPTGLLIALSLLKAGLKVRIIEKHEKETQVLYGRACVLFCRTLEFLEQLEIYDDFLAIGNINKDSATFNKDGIRVENRGWSFVQKTLRGKTFMDYSLGIRQKYSEAVFRKAIHEIDSDAIICPATLTGFTAESGEQYPVHATINSAGQVRNVHCKFIVGADGAHSLVRQLAGINIPSSPSPQRWIRMDALVECDMPAARNQTVAIESPTHGNVLWVPIDHGRTRIGYALSKELSDAYDRGETITPEIAIAEAKKAVSPFKLDVKTLDWYSAYSIQQRVAEHYRSTNHGGRVLLAGDSCHTHSSGAAQGMNTGVHDAFNLGWKLGGYLRGWLKEDVVDTYDMERRASAQTVIDIDKEMSSLIGGKIPPHMLEKYQGKDPNDALIDLFTRNASFTIGLGVSYPFNVLNHANSVSTVQPGERAPDGHLWRIDGILKGQRRLYEILPFTGQFTVVVFTGESDNIRTGSVNLQAFKKLYDHSAVLNHPALRWLTIIGGMPEQPINLLGMDPIGKTFFDSQVNPDPSSRTPESLYESYGVPRDKGALVVIRPDMHLATAFSLEDGDGLTNYFEGILSFNGGVEPGVHVAQRELVERLAVGGSAQVGEDVAK